MVESFCIERTSDVAASPHDGDGHADSFTMSRWTSDGPRDWNAQAGPQQILMTLCLRQTLATIEANGASFHEGVIDRGAVMVVPPGFAVRATFHAASDFMQILVPCHALAQWLDTGGSRESATFPGHAPLHVRDSVVIKLTGTLLRAVYGRTQAGSMYADGIVLSMLARLLEIIAARAVVRPARASSVAPLEAWRVKIAVEFIDQRIDRSLTLAELGASVGLSPMHFAARFRAATGVSPHTFILQRKIEYAQTLLATTRSTVADIAFSVGFRTQAHFTTVFRRHVDDTPYRWRAKHGAIGSAMVRGS